MPKRNKKKLSQKEVKNKKGAKDCVRGSSHSKSVIIKHKCAIDTWNWHSTTIFYPKIKERHNNHH